MTRLAGGIDEVAAGDWDAQVEVRSGGEIGGVLRSFNRMAERLTDERGGMLMTERVAAWREMAQQLAGEVQAGIAPLQKAVEKLRRARDVPPRATRTASTQASATKAVATRRRDALVAATHASAS